MINMRKLILIISIIMLLTGCGREIGTSEPGKENTYGNQISGGTEQGGNQIAEGMADNNGNLSRTGNLKLQYASQYSVDYYEKGYMHIHIEDGTDYVIVPENENENNLGLTNPVYIHMPCDRIYLAASSAMDLFLELDELDSIAACSTVSKDYAMQEVKTAIDSNQITYVGKYSAPDYELLLSRKCNLAIESTMISHSPKIKEQLERVNIPVFVERSSYEENPIGRLEWIKLYGILTGKEAEAESFFNSELEKINQIVSDNASDSTNKKTIAFFSITSNGYVTVRKPEDYICKMIDMAGGEYVLNDLLVEEENALSTINIGMEDFYREAHDADILIYNGSIDGGVNTLDEFLDKNGLLKEFKAVKEGNVWSTSLNMFQESSKIAEVIVEMASLVHDNTQDYTYLKHLK